MTNFIEMSGSHIPHSPAFITDALLDLLEELF
jgi:hypothetical protein